eukprot:Phypoly_transcript_07307.p1 GENE.Phypoly_transcript_07307~~Phypoly_transcript_07307.p1  ORF type:complete len:470 (+),score=91.56 Phypoly_transcript_07307:197-1606(+)
MTNLNTFAQQTGAKLILGLNFAYASNASIAVSELQAINKFFPWSSILALEIGNEQDLYTRGIRAANYTPAEYQSEFSYYVSQLTNEKLTGVKLPTNRIFQGGALCCETAFENAVPAFMTAEKNSIKTYSQHYYSGNAATYPPTLSQVLSPSTLSGIVARMNTFVPDAKKLGIDLWLGESNSVAAGGQVNVSDVFGSALWGMDYMMAMAQQNVTGINFHWAGIYMPFFATYMQPNVVQPRGLFYAMWLFAQTLRNASVVLSPSINTTNNLVTSYVACGEDSTLRVVVVNKDIKTTNATFVTIDVSESGAYASPAHLVRLVADSPYTQYSITLAGQTFFNTTDGIPTGARTTIPVVGNNGVYTFTMPPASIAMLEITPTSSSTSSTTKTTSASPSPSPAPATSSTSATPAPTSSSSSTPSPPPSSTTDSPTPSPSVSPTSTTTTEAPGESAAPRMQPFAWVICCVFLFMLI